jgi:3-hydroxybutyryl-CoA dehydrogenase
MSQRADFSKIFVAGSGFMGSAIAYLVASKTKATVYLYDNSSAQLVKAKAAIDKISNSSVEKSFVTKEQLQEILSRVVSTEEEKMAHDVDLVIEAITEDLDIKRKFFGRLDKVCPERTIFASNTSSLPISSLASATQRASKFIGMHFFSPAHVMKLLEIIPGADTSHETIERIVRFGEQLGKTVIRAKDMPGFITTRLGLVLVNEAAYALMEGLGTAQDIDTGMTLGYNHPMGPLALADFIGLDVCLHIMKVMQDGFGDPKYTPCPLIKQLVSEGHLGRKSGKGFYEYGSKS